MSIYNQESSWRHIEQQYTYSDPLAVIYEETQWIISKVSPMHNIPYVPSKMKQWAAIIRQSLGSAVNINATLTYKIQVEVLPLLKFSEDDNSAIMITVKCENRGKSEVVYVGILMSWGTGSKIDVGVHLPYMLERGKQKLGCVIKSILQSIFDCTIKQFEFTQMQLLQFAFDFVETGTSKVTDPFVLSYLIPHVGDTDKLDVALEVRDICIIWNGVKNEVEDGAQRVSKAYQVLRRQIISTIDLNVAVLDLCRVKMPNAIVTRDGVFSMRTPEIVNSVFTVLNAIYSTV